MSADLVLSPPRLSARSLGRKRCRKRRIMIMQEVYSTMSMFTPPCALVYRHVSSPVPACSSTSWNSSNAEHVLELV